MDKGQIIFFDKNTCKCFNVEGLEVKEVEPNFFDATTSKDSCVFHIIGFAQLPEFHFTIGREPIELDANTMKEILKYNKEVEIERLDNIIKNKKEELDKLKKQLQDKTLLQKRKLKNIKEFVLEFLKQEDYENPYEYIKSTLEEEYYEDDFYD